MSTGDAFAELEAIMDRLRNPGGCPWDREQTYETLRGFLLEECHEVLEALDRGNRQALLEELGDLLLQIFFLARLAKEEGHFSVGDVARTIAEKMIRRHPHVFGSARADTAEDVLRHWEAIKRQERDTKPRARERRGSILSGIPKSLPALLKAQRLGERASRVGFDWEQEADVLAKLDEELEELKSSLGAADVPAVRDELGDLLFTLVMLARRHGIDPEQALERTNRKFDRRFRQLELELERRGAAPETAGLELMDRLWTAIKRRESRGGSDSAE